MFLTRIFQLFIRKLLVEKNFIVLTLS